MKELRTSIKRIYSRFFVVTALVVFGAIAIAQAQKGQSGSDTSPDPAELSTVDAVPIPVVPTDNQDAGIQTVSGELALPDSDATPLSEWSQPDTGATRADYEQDLNDLPAELPETAPPDARPRTNPYRSQPDELYTSDVQSSDLEAPPLLDSDLLPPEQREPGPGEDDRAPAPIQPTPDLPPNDAFLPSDLPPTTSGYLPEEEATDLPPVSNDDAFGDSQYGAYSQDLEVAADDAIQPQQTLPPANQTLEDPKQVPAQLPPAEFAPTQVAPGTAYSGDANLGDGFDQRDQIEENGVPPMAVASRASAAVGKPGPQTMEGPQTPTLTLQKTAPTEVQVGQPAKFEIRVRNVGRVPANNVLIRDMIPAGTKFIEATPKANQAEDGSIYWELGGLPPGQEVTVSMQFEPITEGLVGSVATVTFEASASVRTRSTKPDLVLDHTGPLKVLVGDVVRFAIKLSNPGSGVARHVVLEEDVPVGLSHSSGSKLEYEVGAIQPGQTRRLELTLKAAEAGRVVNNLVARADGGLVVEDSTELEVVAPDLQVAIDGPKVRYLERQATFTVTVANPGTAPARAVELMAYLPRGLQFVSTNNSGYFDKSRNAVIWSLEQLPAGEMGRAQFTAMPIEIGSYQVRAEGKGDMGLQAQQEHPIAIEGIAALMYSLADKVDPIEVGGQTTYELTVTNQGSKDATNVRFAAIAPEGMRALSAQGPTAESIQGQQIQFAPLDRLPPKGEARFRILVQGQAAGDHRFRVQMTSDEITTPVIKEESTRIYTD